MAGVHPRFDRAKAEAFLARTSIPRDKKVGKLSKGMVTQLHLALVMAIDAKLLVLDEPTLGLDILFRKQFYDSLLNDYFDGKRTIVVTTHQVEEIQHVLTDLVFIDRGRIVLDSTHGGLRDALRRGDGAARATPRRRARWGRSTSARSSAAASCSSTARTARSCEALGEVRTPSIADVFVAVMATAGAREGGRMKGAFYWSVRRELWEHRAVYIAPLAWSRLRAARASLVRRERARRASRQLLAAARRSSGASW